MKTANILKNVTIFKGLNNNQLVKLAALCDELSFEEEDRIFEKNSCDKDIYILINGRVNIEVSLGDGIEESASLHIVKPGQPFGEIALVDGNPRSAAAVVLKKSEVFKILKDDIENLFKSDIEIGYIVMKNIASLLCDRIRKTSGQLKASLMWDIV